MVVIKQGQRYKRLGKYDVALLYAILGGGEIAVFDNTKKKGLLTTTTYLYTDAQWIYRGLNSVKEVFRYIHAPFTTRPNYNKKSGGI